MAKRILLLLFCCFFWGLSEGLAAVKEIEIYRNGVFIVEEFEVAPGESKIFLLAPVREEEIEFEATSPGLEILSLEIVEAEPQTALHERLKTLKARERELSSKLEKIEKELELLQKALEAGKEPPSAAELPKYFALFSELWQEREKTRAALEELRQELAALRRKVAFEKVTAVNLLARGQGRLSLRYPAGKLITYRESYALFLDTKAPALKIKASLLLWQRSGKPLGPLTVRFYPRSRRYGAISPPPFRPWILEDLRSGLRLEGTQALGKHIKPRVAEREVSEGAIWERLTLRNVSLSAGGPNHLSLAEERLPLKSFLVEVPLYATTQAFFRADLLPERSYPRLRAKLYLDGSFVGESWCGPFEPGKETSVYFGPAHLVEVKHEILKDLSGASFWGQKVQERETRASIVNHYRRKMSLEVVERVPVPRKKGVKVEVKADPPWTERTPEGKVVWRFGLAPEEKKTIWFYLKIKRPKDG